MTRRDNKRRKKKNERNEFKETLKNTSYSIKMESSIQQQQKNTKKLFRLNQLVLIGRRHPKLLISLNKVTKFNVYEPGPLHMFPHVTNDAKKMSQRHRSYFKRGKNTQCGVILLTESTARCENKNKKWRHLLNRVKLHNVMVA